MKKTVFRLMAVLLCCSILTLLLPVAAIGAEAGLWKDGYDKG